MQTVLLSHFYNEAFLLPFWIRHHLPLFDRAILVDRDSTDDGADLVRTLAPHWELRRSRYPQLDAPLVDREMMEIERSHEGWKLILNTTEFLMTGDLRRDLSGFAARWPAAEAMAIPSAVMVDPPALRGTGVSPHIPLVLQRTWGYWDNPYQQPGTECRGFRYLHRGRDGAYGIGKHRTRLRSRVSGDVWINWYGWSPFPEVKQRRLQIQQGIPAANASYGWGRHHMMTPENLEATYQHKARSAVDLGRRPTFSACLERIGAALGHPFRGGQDAHV